MRRLNAAGVHADGKPGAAEQPFAERFAGVGGQRRAAGKDAWGSASRGFEYVDDERAGFRPRPASGPGRIGSLDAGFDARRFKEDGFRSHSARGAVFRGLLPHRSSEPPRGALALRVRPLPCSGHILSVTHTLYAFPAHGVQRTQQLLGRCDHRR